VQEHEERRIAFRVLRKQALRCTYLVLFDIAPRLGDARPRRRRLVRLDLLARFDEPIDGVEYE
jgi:hypothetical protein